MSEFLKDNQSAKSFFLILGLILNLAAVTIYGLDQEFVYRWFVLALWVLGMTLALTPLFSILKKGWKLIYKREELLFLIVLIVFSAFFRFYDLNRIPILSGDEVRDAGFLPENFLKGEIKDFFGYGVYGIPNLFFAFSSLAHLLFGHSILAIRFFAAFFGVLSVVLTYSLAKKYFGLKVGKITALLMAVYHIHLHFSRSEFLVLLDSFWAPLIAILLLDALKERFSPLLLGIVLGMAFHFYQGIRAFLLLIVVYFLIWALFTFRRSVRSFWLKVSHFFAGLFLGLGPSLLVILTRPNEAFNTGTAGKPLFFSLGLREFLRVLPFHLYRSLGSIVYYPTDFHYRYGGPFIKFPFSCFFILGLFFLVKNTKRKQNSLLLFWIFFVFLFNSAILVDLNFTHRLLSVIPSIMIILALGIVKFANFFKKNPFLSRSILFLVVFAFIFFNLKLYFFDSVWVNAVDTNTKVATMAGYYTASFPLETKFYFLNSQRMSWKSGPNWRYIAPRAQIEDINKDAFAHLLLKPHSRNEKSVFIVLPERKENLEIIKVSFPGGFSENHYYNQEWLFITYELP